MSKIMFILSDPLTLEPDGGGGESIRNRCGVCPACRVRRAIAGPKPLARRGIDTRNAR